MSLPLRWTLPLAAVSLLCGTSFSASPEPWPTGPGGPEHRLGLRAAERVGDVLQSGDALTLQPNIDAG